MLYLEDLPIGRRFAAGPLAVTAADIKRFAGEFDPQPFHLDEAAAAGTFFAGLAASGWHSAALGMRLLVQAVPIAGGIIGAGVDDLRWLLPVRPGDVLRLQAEVRQTRVSASRPAQGWVKMLATTINQEERAVQTMMANLMVPTRPAAVGA